MASCPELTALSIAPRCVIVDISLSSDSSCSVHFAAPLATTPSELCNRRSNRVADYLKLQIPTAQRCFLSASFSPRQQSRISTISGESLSRHSKCPPGSSSPTTGPSVTRCAPILVPWWTPILRFQTPLLSLNRPISYLFRKAHSKLASYARPKHMRHLYGEPSRHFERFNTLYKSWSQQAFFPRL